MTELNECELNLEGYFALTMSSNQIRLMAYYAEDLEQYLISKGFELTDYLYADDTEKFEYKNGNINIILFKE